MLEYTAAGDGLRLKMLVLHDDAKREYAYGPAEGLADTKVGTFTQTLFDEANKDGWTIVSMKNEKRSSLGKVQFTRCPLSLLVYVGASRTTAAIDLTSIHLLLRITQACCL
jgi:hypothetical protein